MKKIVFLILSVLLMGSMASASSGKCGAELTWNLDQKGVLTIRGKGAMKDFGRSSSPWNPSNVEYIIIEEGVTSIGKWAFAGCRKVVNVALPPTVTDIRANSFKGCERLAVITLPYGLLTIGDAAFEGCDKLVQVHIPGSVTAIGDKAFAGCELIQSVNLPSRLKAVGVKAFDKCRSISEITSLPDFIIPANCSEFGLPSRLVEKYLSAKGADTAVAAVAADNTKPGEGKGAEPKRSRASVEGKSYGQSDIDMNIPVKPSNNERTFAFIFANEEYTEMPDVPFAINDGKTFAAYCHSTLGLPECNINAYYNATYGNMHTAMEYLKQVDATFGGDINVIVYYAGHGAPDEKSAESYLIPVDASKVNSKSCYPLSEFYAELGSLKSKSIKVFMDACFSGADRSNEMLAEGGRLVTVVPKKESVTGNVVVISAASKDQSAWYHKEEGHGLFTYCLIKKLQESRGDLTLGELSDYLIERIPRISIIQNRVLQNPTLQSSARLGNSWRMWTVK